MRLPKTEMASDGRDIFIVIDGVRVANAGGRARRKHRHGSRLSPVGGFATLSTDS
jgi:hypothetical protein